MEKEVNTKIAEHEVKIKSLEKRVLKCESKDEILNKLVISVEKMAVVQEGMLKEQQKQREEISKIKEQPAEDYREIRQKVIISIITGVVGAILGAVLALIIK